jgi:hypothetical protein
MLLVLEGYCIETAARRERRRIEARLLELDPVDPGLRSLAGDLELLTEFLRGIDFSALRAARPELDGRADVTVELRRDDAGRITCYTVSSE